MNKNPLALRALESTPSRLRRTPPWQGERICVMRACSQNKHSPLLIKEGWRRAPGWLR